LCLRDSCLAAVAVTEEAMMHPVVREQLGALPELCRAHRVRRLTLFGSATTEEFDAQGSDIDLVVDFQPMPIREYAGNYFALLDALQELFGRQVDLVEQPAIRNPYIRQAIEETQVPLYEAA
jgi:predicted nucleotidyltransferase